MVMGPYGLLRKTVCASLSQQVVYQLKNLIHTSELAMGHGMPAELWEGRDVALC